jgi:transposase
MEATGVYWKPVWHILDDGEFELVLANPAHVKNVPGRKTDVNDAMRLAELLAHGLIRSSFVPDTQTQEMRSLLRTRKQLIREQSSHTLRVQKTLEDANIKLDSVLSDLMGRSGRAMIEGGKQFFRVGVALISGAEVSIKHNRDDQGDQTSRYDNRRHKPIGHNPSSYK